LRITVVYKKEKCLNVEYTTNFRGTQLKIPADFYHFDIGIFVDNLTVSNTADLYDFDE